MKSAGLRLSQRLIVAGQYLAGDCDHTITVMGIEEVGKSLFPDPKLRVRSLD
jgi:hypothetical protein